MADWVGERLVVGSEQFVAVWEDEEAWIRAALRFACTTPESLAPAEVLSVCKTRPMIDQMVGLLESLRPRRVLELGVYLGGSTALIAAVVPEAKVVAIELNEHRAPDLEEYLDRSGARDRVHVHYGVDQADRERVQQIVVDEFDGEPVDLVIDDASHVLAASRASLDAVLPFVAPGGCYVVEDWGWKHLVDAREDAEVREHLPSGPGLTALIAELAMAVASQTDVVTRMELNGTWALAWRGSAVLDPERFTLADAYRNDEPLSVR
jgi:predicted O-methyltransferase YrrM